MKIIKIHRVIAVIATLLVAACACWGAQTKAKLVVNGKTASSDVKIINGKPYAPLSDVARALNMTVTKSGDTYKMAVAGGANQVNGSRQGRIGSEVFTGKWKFQVVSIETKDEYVERYYKAKRTIKPQSSGETLLVINCRIKNGMKKAIGPVLTERMPGNTGLAVDGGQSYAPIDYDAKQAEDKTQSYEAANLLPGAGADFALIFSVPQGTNPKSLVFTLITYPDDVPGKGADVRIELTK